VIFEAFVEPRLGQHDISGDGDQTAGGECRADGRRRGAGIGVDEQDNRIEDIADTDHSLHLPALSRPARQRLGRQFATDVPQLVCRRIQKKQRSDAHQFATGERNWRNLRGKAFRFGIFRAEILPCEGLFALVCTRKSAAWPVCRAVAIHRVADVFGYRSQPCAKRW
jgi:hypothetical protein